MSKVTNPFVVKGLIPDAYFCGREEETKRLSRELLNQNNVVLKSPRRLGKTGLIRHCLNRDEFKDYYVFFVDILQTSSLQELAYTLGQAVFNSLKPFGRKMTDLFIQTVRSIRTEYTYDALSGMPKFSFALGAIEQPQTTLAEIFQYIEAADKRCIVAIDEFQRIADYPEKNVEAILRTQIQQMSNCDFIFAGSDRHLLDLMFHDSSRPFYNSASTMELDALSKDTYLPFVQQHFASDRKSISQVDAERVYDLFDGVTYYMQRTFNVAYSLIKPEESCTLAVLQTAIEEILSDNERDYQRQLALLGLRQKELLFAIAKQGKAKQITSSSFIHRHHLSSASSIQSVSKQLLENGWITFYINEQGEKIYTLSDLFLALWIQNHFGDGDTL